MYYVCIVDKGGKNGTSTDMSNGDPTRFNFFKEIVV